MDGAMMTSSGNKTTRLRNAANMVLARNSKHRQSNNRNNHNTVNNHKNNRNVTTRSNSLRNNANHKYAVNYNRININVNGGNKDGGNKDGGVCIGNHVMGKNSFYKGKFAREVYNAICLRLGHTAHIPGDSVQALFNDMHLYPSKSQVSEMLHCARQCGRRNGATPFLTFGEFCVFAREMQRPKQHKKIQQQQQTKTNKCISKCEVFLGGSCNPTTWRTDTAIPELQKHGITFYNPQVSMWAPELVAQEHDAKQSASVLLYVVDSQTRSTAGMIEVAFLVASGRCVVLVVYPYRVGQSIMGENISNREYFDLVEGQTSLLMLMKTSGVKVHNSLPAALQCTTNILRQSNGLTPEEQITQKLRKLREAFDSYDVNRTGELHLNDVLDAYYRLTNRSLKISDLYNYLSATNNADQNRLRITFEQFCALVAEFSTDGCETFTTTTDGRFTDPLYWTSTLLKTRHLLRFYIIRPIANILEWASQPLQRQCSMNNNSHYDINSHINNCTVESQIKLVTNGHTLKNGTSELVDVFLGGSCSTEVTWREDVAIPLVKKYGLTYYNPAIRETNCNNLNDLLTNRSTYFNGKSELCDESVVLESEVLRWKETMDKSKVLLFVITNDTRSLTTMILAAYFIGQERNVVLCVQQLATEDCEIYNEKLSKQAIKDYNRGRVYLADLAKRKQIPVFENITEAVQCAIDRCQENSR